MRTRLSKLALIVADELSGLDKKTVGKDGQPLEGKVPRVGTLIFLSQAEIAALAKTVAALITKDANTKIDSKKLVKTCQSVPLSDAADIAIFGRMVANGPEMTLEGAAMFSHALSTHKADNDIDYFAAVDDDKPKEEDSGAAMISTLEFTSAVYYRYAALNLGLSAGCSSDGSSSRVRTYSSALSTGAPGRRPLNTSNATPRAWVC